MENMVSGFVRLSPAARIEVKKLLEERSEEGLGLRLAVAGGGCSGLSYKLDFTLPRPGDRVMEVEPEGISVYIDPKSLLYLKDMEVDYQGGLAGRGFTFRNPNAQNTCGCGESFSV